MPENWEKLWQTKLSSNLIASKITNLDFTERTKWEKIKYKINTVLFVVKDFCQYILNYKVDRYYED